MRDHVVQLPGDPGALRLVGRLDGGRGLGPPGAGRVAEYERGTQQRERRPLQARTVAGEHDHHGPDQRGAAEPAGVAPGSPPVAARPVGGDQHRRERGHRVMVQQIADHQN